MNDVLINKASIIERCIARVNDVYKGHEAEFKTDLNIQDVAVLNIQRACEASIDMATYIIKEKQLGIPQSSRDSFQILIDNKIIDSQTGDQLMKMVGFRNIAVHNYDVIDMDIVESIINHALNDLQKFSSETLKSL